MKLAKRIEYDADVYSQKLMRKSDQYGAFLGYQAGAKYERNKSLQEAIKAIIEYPNALYESDRSKLIQCIESLKLKN